MPTHAPDFNGDGREDIAYLDTIRVSNQLIAQGAGTSAGITYTYFRHVKVICRVVSTSAQACRSRPHPTTGISTVCREPLYARWDDGVNT